MCVKVLLNKHSLKTSVGKHSGVAGSVALSHSSRDPDCYRKFYRPPHPASGPDPLWPDAPVAKWTKTPKPSQKMEAIITVKGD